MVVRHTDRIHSQEVEALAPEGDHPQEKNSSGFALHQIFGRDTLEDNGLIEMSPITSVIESQTPAFWSKIFSWWYEPDVKAQTVSSLGSDIDLLDVADIEPISPVPKLDGPDSIPDDLSAAQVSLASKKKTQKEKLSPEQLAECMELMKNSTIEQIMRIIFKAQLELEKENANVAESTITKYQNFRKIQEKMLYEIKDALAKDEKLLSRFKNAQQIAYAAAIITAVAVVIVSSGAFLPAALVAIAKPFEAAGPFMTAVLTGATLTPKAISQRKVDLNKAKKEEFSHQDKYFSDRIDDSQQRLMTIADADSDIKNRWISVLLKRMQKMSQLVLAK